MNNNILYIGLKGYAGSGKDTVAKMLKVILDNENLSFNDCYNKFIEKYSNKNSATLNDSINDHVYCIAYADELKIICSNISGVPVEKFYTNKSNGWINVNGDFTYTEIMPNKDNIITAKEYIFNSSSIKLWMSLREFLVYIGTYILQYNLNKNTFVNIIKNKIKNIKLINNDLKYVIITDNRFYHEVDFIKDNNGILLSIERDNINKLPNIAENDLDDMSYFDDMYYYTITNNGSYYELFEKLYKLIKSKLIFSNITYKLQTIDNINNYIRYTGIVNEGEIFEIIYERGINLVSHNNNEIIEISLIGCMNSIKINSQILGTPLVCKKILYNDKLSKYFILV